MAVPVHSNHGVLAVTSGLTSLSFTLPAGSGDLLVFNVIKENTAAITKPAAATQKSQVAISDPEQQTIFYGRVSDLGAGPYAFSWTGSTFAGGSVHRISGAVGSGDPFNAFDHQFSNVNSTTTPAVTVTTTSPDCLLLFFGMGISGSSVWTPPASFTEIFESSNQTGDRLDKAAAGSSGSLTADSGNSDHKAAFLGAVLPAGGESDQGWRFRLQPPGLLAPMRAPLAPWAGTGADTTGPKTISADQAAEVEVAQAVTPLRTYAAAQASETEVAQAITVRKTVAVAQASETELAQAVGKAKAAAVAQAAETEVAQTATVRKAVAVAQAAETELGQTATPKGVIGQAIETEVAQAFGKVKARAAGQASETEVAQAITVRKTVAVAQAVETELGQTFTRVKTRTLGQAAETETGQAVGKLKRAAVAQAAETELAQTVTTTGHKIIAVGQAAETEVAQAFTRVKTRVLTQAAETELGQAVAKRLAYQLGQALEEELGQAVLTGVRVSSPPGRIVVGIGGGTLATLSSGGVLVAGPAGGTIILLRSGALSDLYTDLYGDLYAALVGPPGIVRIDRPDGTLTIGE